MPESNINTPMEIAELAIMLAQMPERERLILLGMIKGMGMVRELPQSA